LIEVSEEVITALEQGLPVVALESAVISHGLPKSVACDCAFDMRNRGKNRLVQGTIRELEPETQATEMPDSMSHTPESTGEGNGTQRRRQTQKRSRRAGAPSPSTY